MHVHMHLHTPVRLLQMPRTSHATCRRRRSATQPSCWSGTSRPVTAALRSVATSSSGARAAATASCASAEVSCSTTTTETRPSSRTSTTSTVWRRRTTPDRATGANRLVPSSHEIRLVSRDIVRFKLVQIHPILSVRGICFEIGSNCY